MVLALCMSSGECVVHLQSVIQACEGDVGVAKAWLVDMDPFVAEANELPDQLPPMYVTEDTHSGSVRNVAGRQRENTTASGSEDVYWAHRQGAVRLTREWRKLFRKCVSAGSLSGTFSANAAFKPALLLINNAQRYLREPLHKCLEHALAVATCGMQWCDQCS